MPVHIDRSNNATETVGRIPSTLQNVFLASNRGIEVNAPPPLRVADKVFKRSLLGRTYSSESSDIRRGRREKLKQSSFALRFWNKGGTLQRSSADEAPQDVRPPEIIQKRKSASNVPSLSPQQYLDAMTSARGYYIQPHATLSSAYYNMPTPLQLASYGSYVVALVKSDNDSELGRALACGLSSNPCNAFGESLLHSACRRGNDKLLQVMLAAGCDVQISDDCGRTPLHYACWASEPAFDMIERLLERDVGLLYMADARGSLALAYTRKEHWSAWLQFLESKKELFWPRKTSKSTPPAIAVQQPNTRPHPPPKAPLTLELAGMVADGRMSPEEAQFLTMTQSDEASDDSDVGLSDDSRTDDESTETELDDAADPSSSSSEDDMWNEDEMNDILNSLLATERRPLQW